MVTTDSTASTEVKAMEYELPTHEAKLLTNLKLCKIKTGFLPTFHVRCLKDGINRRIY